MTALMTLEQAVTPLFAPLQNDRGSFIVKSIIGQGQVGRRPQQPFMSTYPAALSVSLSVCLSVISLLRGHTHCVVRQGLSRRTRREAVCGQADQGRGLQGQPAVHPPSQSRLSSLVKIIANMRHSASCYSHLSPILPVTFP